MAISSPPPKAVPCIAMTTGFAAILDFPKQRQERNAALRLPGCDLSELADVGPGDEGAAASDDYRGLDVSSAASWSMHSEIPSGTPGLSAFTGGLLIVMMATSPSRVS